MLKIVYSKKCDKTIHYSFKGDDLIPKRLVALALSLMLVPVQPHAETVNEINQMMKERYAMRNTKEINIELTFYTDLYGDIDASGRKVRWGTIAIPRNLPLGTKFEIDIYPGQTFIGSDHGAVEHIRVKKDGTYRIDVFCPRIQGESNDEYFNRVYAYSKVKTTGRYIISE